MLNNSASPDANSNDSVTAATLDREFVLKTHNNDKKMKTEKQKTTTLKHSYTIPCTSEFRDRVGLLAERRKVNVADLARSVLLMVSYADISKFSDPGDPVADDRETVILKSGPSKGRPWRRKPRLQVRMAPGYEVLHIRKALNLALYMEAGKAQIRIDTADTIQAKKEAEIRMRHEVEEQAKQQAVIHNLPETMEEIDRLRAMVSVLSFDPLIQGIQDRGDALHILGFAPKAYPDRSELRARFRMLATIHHPDGKYGSHERMSQLNQAMEVLRPVG